MEAFTYLAAAECAWLRWSRQALEHIITHALNQASSGEATPLQVRTAGDAAQAEAKCSVHIRLLAAFPEDLAEPNWPWQLEAARHVHSASREALKIASELNPFAPDIQQIRGGTSSLADALVIACAAGFLETPATEVTRTIDAMLLAAT